MLWVLSPTFTPVLQEIRLLQVARVLTPDWIKFNLVPRAFPLKKWVGREKALASAGHVHSLNIPEKLIYMQPAGFVLTEVERSNDIYRDLYVNIFASVRFKSLRSI